MAPMGPNACSFDVEIPISAPRPSSPPSAKRVLALTTTVDDWIAPTKAAAAASSSVTIASVCEEPYSAM